MSQPGGGQFLFQLLRVRCGSGSEGALASGASTAAAALAMAILQLRTEAVGRHGRYVGHC